MTLSDERLRECPFCGAELEVHGVGGVLNARHPSGQACFLAGRGVLIPADVEAWNLRANATRVERETLENAAGVADAVAQKLRAVPHGIGVAPFAVADDIAAQLRSLIPMPTAAGKDDNG